MFRLRWHTVFIAALTLGLLWLFFRNIELHETWRAITHARPGLILAAVVVTLLTYIVRAWRWQALLRPIGQARFRTAFRTTVIGFTATFLLPARIGEVLRPYLLARTEGLKFTAAFATIIIERLLDVCTVVMLFALALPFVNVDVGREVKTASAIAAVSTRRIRGPRSTTCQPLALATAISSSVNPPSGPTATRQSAGVGVNSATGQPPG